MSDDNIGQKTCEHIISRSPLYWGLYFSNCSSDEKVMNKVLEKIIRKENMPIDVDYLLKIVKKSKISRKEVMAILYPNPKNGITVLWAYCLLKMAENDKLVSIRYSNFLGKAASLLMQSKFKVALKKISPGQVNVSSRYEPKTNTLEIYLDGSKGKNRNILEATMLHEIFHGYQDYQKLRTTRNKMEAEAHLLARDYLYHVNPGVSASSWIEISFSRDAYSMEFSIPATLVAALIKFNENSTSYKNAINQIAEQYAKVFLFLQLLESQPAVHTEKVFISIAKAQSKMTGKPFNANKAGQEIIDAFKSSTTEHVVISLNSDRSKITDIRMSQELIEFLAVLRIHLDTLWRKWKMGIDSGADRKAQKNLEGVLTLLYKKVQIPEKIREMRITEFDGVQ